MESLSKNKIKWIRSLRLKKYRDRERCFILEGEKMVREALAERPDDILCICGESEIPEFNGERYFADAASLKEISTLSTPNKYLAVVRMPEFKPQLEQFVLAIDGVQDPGNLGTIIRTADWFGIDKVVCSQDSADIFNQKVIQASMGSIFRVPVEYTDLELYLSKSPLPVYGALLKGTPLDDMKLSTNGIIVVGNEGNGIREEIQHCIEHPVFIPGFGGAESLNVAVATGILLAAFRLA